MKILAVHADYIEYQATKKALKSAEANIKEEMERVEECLVIFTSVEKRDEGHREIVLEQYQQEVDKVADQVKPKNIVVYPYAHLSSSLASPQYAEEFLKAAEKKLSVKYNVYRAPFGWYKAFTIKSKGHPLSELSREFGQGENIPSVNKASPAENTPASTNLKRESKDELFEINNKDLSVEEKINLTAALLTGAAIQELFVEAKIGSIGFYHNQTYVDITGVKIKSDDLERIQKHALKLAQKGTSIEKVVAPTHELQKQIAQDLKKDAYTYQLSKVECVPTYANPFIANTKEIGALKLLSLSSAYWKNNASNLQLIRINLVGFRTQEELEKFQKEKEDQENRSHIKIGKEQGLFIISELVGPGLPLIAPKGMIIRNEITSYLWSLHKDKGYQQVWTPHIAKTELYKTSGHWDKFGDELFKVKGKTDDFVMKPMNCPHHMQIFDAFNHSYRDMPIRFFEPATIYRDEKSGQLTGLSRVRAITQDDGHLFCRTSQIKQEVKTIVGIIHEFYATLGMDKDYWVSLSVRGDDKSKYLGEDAAWNLAETSLEEAAIENKLPYKRIPGEAAFYGPKLDFMFKDALGREWQLATIQCDFNLPERFNLSYMNEEGKKERPVVIHRAISGSLERFLSILIEHHAGKFPLWLSPVQVKIVTVTDRNVPFARDLKDALQKHGIRVEVNEDQETIGKKVRDAQMEKVNYIVTIGDKEMEKNCLAIRTRAGDVKFEVNIADFIKDLRTEIDTKKN